MAQPSRRRPPLGFPIVERPLAQSPSLKGRGEETGAARVEEPEVSPAPQPSVAGPDGLMGKLLAFTISVLVTIIVQK
ncbi:MAG: hypothetical protein M1831_004394 [Alyxoria varia]|nr:MAG: hypothetical protein M1831_004394 [Alyxoria varia]